MFLLRYPGLGTLASRNPDLQRQFYTEQVRTPQTQALFGEYKERIEIE